MTKISIYLRESPFRIRGSVIDQKAVQPGRQLSVRIDMGLTPRVEEAVSKLVKK